MVPGHSVVREDEIVVRGLPDTHSWPQRHALPALSPRQDDERNVHWQGVAPATRFGRLYRGFELGVVDHFD
jgi:hypothetical protein